MDLTIALTPRNVKNFVNTHFPLHDVSIEVSKNLVDQNYNCDTLHDTKKTLHLIKAYLSSSDKSKVRGRSKTTWTKFWKFLLPPLVDSFT